MVVSDDVKRLVSVVTGLLKLDSEILGKDAVSLYSITNSFAGLATEEKSFVGPFPEKPSEGSHRGIYYQYFVRFVGAILQNVCQSLEKEHSELRTYSWSSEEIKNVSCLIQFYVKFSILPHLQKGVGKKCNSKITSGYNCFSPSAQLTMAFNNLTILFKICKECLTLRNIVIENSLSSVIGALMQFCFSPKSAKVLEKTARQNCMHMLNELVESWITKARFVEEMLVLQGNLSEQIVPKWLRDKCGLSLTRILLQQDGIKVIVMSMVSRLTDSEPGDSSSWEKVIALSTIISTIPSTGITVEKYCELACPQLLELLASAKGKPNELSQDIVRISVTTIQALHEKFPEESRIFEKIICFALSCCCSDNNGELEPKLSLVGEENLAECIENLHQICVAVGVAPDSLLLLLIRPYSKLLFTLLCDVQDSPTHLKTFSTQLLIALLKSVDKRTAAEMLINFYSDHKTQTLTKRPIKNLKFTSTENCGIIPVIRNTSCPAEVLQQQDTKVRVLTEIILDFNVEGLPGEVLLLLLKYLCKPEKNIPCQPDDASAILSPEDKASEALSLNEERFITFGLLSALCETLDPNTLLSDISQILTFIEALLESLDLSKSDSEESLRMCIGVIGICLMSELDSRQRERLDHVASLLDVMSSKSGVDDKTKDLISDVLIAIRTHGAVNHLSYASFSKAMRDELTKIETLKEQGHSQEPSRNEKKVKIEEIHTQRDAPEVKVKPVNDSNNPGSLEMSFNEALEEVFDPTPAIKGGSIRYLTSCIKQKLPVAVKNLEKLSKIFLENLEHEESFVFLSALQGLVVIIGCGANKALLQKLFDEIVSKFASCDVENLKTQADIECRMKFGEILTRVVRDFGDLASHHAADLLPEFLKGAKHSNPDMRASCLSNFAELAPIAIHFLPKIQHEVRECLCGLAMSDTDQLVRRSAVYAIHQLVNKLGQDVLRVLDGVIKEFYSSLKVLYVKEADEKVKLHAQLALEELDKIMRSAIFKPTVLSKTIRIDR